MKKSYDKAMDQMYVLMSALQKAVRWGEINDARYFAQNLIEMGKPGAALNRLMTIAPEDVGLADPTLLKYVAACQDWYEAMLKDPKVTKSTVADFPEICAAIDRAVIAAALSYKSRVLPMLSFATLFEIYKKEDFSRSLAEYKNLLRASIQRQDDQEAAYYAFILAFFLGSEHSVFGMVDEEGKTRNTALIGEWTYEYKRTKEKLLLMAGIISLLCRDLNYPHGEYHDQISNYVSLPIKSAAIPDRAYDMHTALGQKRNRGLTHFFKVAGSVKNERFPNDWEERGKKAYYDAQKEGLERARKVIEAIEGKLKKMPGRKKAQMELLPI